LHHFELDQWNRGNSFLHRRDARAKIAGLFVLLLCIGLTPAAFAAWLWLYALLPLAGLRAARIPLSRALAFAAAVIPFALPVAVVQWPAAGWTMALALVVKSYVSALSALALVATTPLPKLAQGLVSLGAPRFLVLVTQFVYRYLFLVSEQAQHMRLAAASRGAAGGSRYSQARLRAAAGAVGVLFARSYQRAEGTYHAMLARGFSGKIHTVEAERLTVVDWVSLLLVVIASLSCYKVIVLLSQWSR
jgi:cobalt/nickel transport system permease protein